MKKKWIFIILIFIVLFLFCIGIYLSFWNPFLKLQLMGAKHLILEVGEPYKEQGVHVTLFGKDRNLKKGMEGQVDSKKIGNYTLTYSVSFIGTTKKVKRIVQIIDTKVPMITLKGESDIVIFVGTNYIEPGYEANDNYDGNLTESVQVEGHVDSNKAGEYLLKYIVSDSSKNTATAERKVTVKEKPVWKDPYSYGVSIEGPTYIKGILLVNKKYALPPSFAKGTDPVAYTSLEKLQKGAEAAGFSMPLLSGYRTYDRQVALYSGYVKRDGRALADTYSARPGHSEHQTGLTFDVGTITSGFGDTTAGIWLREHCYEYGFIIRYPKGKETITGYSYEPWHIRYVGSVAAEIYQRGITLEEYLEV